MPGWNSDASHPTESDPNLTATIGPFIFHHGNYDYVDGKIADWTSGYSGIGGTGSFRRRGGRPGEA